MSGQRSRRRPEAFLCHLQRIKIVRPGSGFLQQGANVTAEPSVTRQRLEGLDLARYIALIGMVIVNFDVVMVGIETTGSPRLTELLQGRAAATFVVVAGLGFGLGAQRVDFSETVGMTIRRAAFLLLLGVVNMSIFPADIIHYYALLRILLSVRVAVRRPFRSHDQCRDRGPDTELPDRDSGLRVRHWLELGNG